MDNQMALVNEAFEAFFLGLNSFFDWEAQDRLIQAFKLDEPFLGDFEAPPKRNAELLVQVLTGERRDFTDHPLFKDGADLRVISMIVETTLTPRQSRIIRLKFGFDGRTKTQKEVGTHMGVTGSRIMQIESLALRRLRHPTRFRTIKGLLYPVSKEDLEYRDMRMDLCVKLRDYYPDRISHDIAMSLKRPYLAKALSDVAEICQVMALSCRRPMSTCLHCGKMTIPGWAFCDRECQKAYGVLLLICEECGKPFHRREKSQLWRFTHAGAKHYFCGNDCKFVFWRKHCSPRWRIEMTRLLRVLSRIRKEVEA